MIIIKRKLQIRNLPG